MSNQHTKQNLHTILESIAKQEIPDDMDNLKEKLWQNIQAELSGATNQNLARRKRSRSAIRITRIGVVAAILLLSAVAYGFYQQGNDHIDDGLREVEEAGLIHSLDMSAMVGDITVTVDWAYADAHRISIAYRLEAPDDGTHSLGGIIAYRSVLRAENGNVIPGSFGGASGETNLVYEGVNNYNTEWVIGNPEILHLTLEMIVDEDTQAMQASASSSGGGGGGGGFGGGGSASGPAMPPPLPEGFTNLGSAIFEFDVPFIPAVVVEPMQTITSNNLDVTLERVEVTPSMTRAQICYDLADPNLHPRMTLTTEETTIDSFNWVSSKKEQCNIVQFLAPYDREQDAQTWTFTIDRFETPAMYTMEEYQAALAEYGIVFEITESFTSEDGMGGGGGGGITYVPDGVDVNTVIQQVEDSFRETINGSWMFTVTIP